MSAARSTPAAANRTFNRPSWALTISFWIALSAFFFTSDIWLVFVLAIIALWAHFIFWRLPRDSSATWILRLLIYGGVFAFYGAQPGVGADWIFDAKTFNMIGMIAAGETLLSIWREPPHGARYYPANVFCIGVVFLAACNTYDDRVVKIFAPFYLVFTLLALRESRGVAWSTPGHSLPRGRGILALAFVLVLGAATHFGILWQREQIMRWGFQMMMTRRFFQGTGISEQPRLGSTFNLRGTTKRVLKIEGALNSPHLRAASFDTYANGTWSPPVSERAKEAFPESTANQKKDVHRARITKLEDLNGLIFAPLNAVEVTPGAGSSFEWDKTLGPIRCDDKAPYSYEVSWSEKGDSLGVPLYQGILCAPLSKSDAKRMLQLPPEVDPRVRELAFDLTATALHPSEKVEAIAEYLLQNHKYSRTTKRGKGDPVSNFLLQKKSAHCEYFASATVVLLRAAGVPSRYVTGYVAHEKLGDGTVVRQRDAHAWAEAWIDDVGWITVDATPADGSPENSEPVSAWQKWREKLQDEWLKLREKMTGLSSVQIFILIALVVAVWIFERWRVRRKQLSQSSQSWEYSAHADLKTIAARFEKWLAKNGEVSPSRPLVEYSRSDAAKEFLRDYNLARFGGVRDAQTLHDLKIKIEELEKGNDYDAQHDTDIDADSNTATFAQREYSRRG